MSDPDAGIFNARLVKPRSSMESTTCSRNAAPISVTSKRADLSSRKEPGAERSNLKSRGILRAGRRPVPGEAALPEEVVEVIDGLLQPFAQRNFR